MLKKPPQMVEVFFHGPAHYLEAFGQTVKRGTSALFKETEIFALQAEDRIVIEVIGPVADKSGGSTPPEPAAGDGEGHDKTHEKEE